jgi:GT2 family glycosyltransferase
LPESYLLNVYLVDDGSSDGTAQAIHKRYPSVNIIRGDGNLYWNGGMWLAFNTAIEKGYDFYLWLNDDTLLYPTAIKSLIKNNHELSQQEGKAVVVIGSTQDEASGRLNYGGLVRSVKWKPINFKLVSTRTVPVKCQTMNGNCVLIPNEIVQKVGNLEPNFVHTMGDLDYGLRVGYAGFSVWVMPGFAGTCPNNQLNRTFSDRNNTKIERLKAILHPKILPPKAWWIFTLRHCGIFGPLYWVYPYLKLLLSK